MAITPRRSENQWVQRASYSKVSSSFEHGPNSNALRSMGRVPRWRNLKHFPNVTTEEYTDGQAFLDILKVFRHHLFSELFIDTSAQCILPCINHTAFTVEFASGALHQSVPAVSLHDWIGMHRRG